MRWECEVRVWDGSVRWEWDRSEVGVWDGRVRWECEVGVWDGSEMGGWNGRVRWEGEVRVQNGSVRWSMRYIHRSVRHNLYMGFQGSRAN